MSDGENKDSRKMSDIILSLEEKINNLVKTIAVHDMNNKLILDRLNKIVQFNTEQQNQTKPATPAVVQQSIISAPQNISVNSEPTVTRKQPMVTAPEPPPLPTSNAMQEAARLPQSIPQTNLASQIEEFKTKKESKKAGSKLKETIQSVTKDATTQDVSTPVSFGQSKIPVSQRITDQQGKDLFMADVTITNLVDNEITKAKTSAVGKWNAYLSPGKYTVHISKTVDANTLNKIESLQAIEITPTMKSLQLPIAIIKR